jgi:hypothetical protein
MKEMRRQDAPSVEVTLEATHAYSAETSRRMQKFVWTSSCQSWYKLDGQVLATYPGSATEYYWSLADIHWADFHFKATKPLPRPLHKRVLRRLLLLCAFLLAVGASAPALRGTPIGRVLAPALAIIPSALSGVF